jgi:hypothetical protein
VVVIVELLLQGKVQLKNVVMRVDEPKEWI